jgi:hypothetical protein
MNGSTCSSTGRFAALAAGGVVAAVLGLASATALAMTPADAGDPAAPQQLMWRADEIAAFERQTGGWPSRLAEAQWRLPG